MFCGNINILLKLLVIFCVVRTSFCLTFKYHNNTELECILKNFTNTTTNIKTRLYKIGNSLNKIPLWAIELTAAKDGDLGIPNVKLIGNIHGNEAVGREIILNFMEYLRSEYDSNKTIQWLLNKTRIHFLPTMNPDGFAVSHEGMCVGEHGRGNGKSGIVTDLNRNFPDYYHENKIPTQPETKAVMKWMEEIPFILSAGLHGGAVVANYPFDTVKEEKWNISLQLIDADYSVEEKYLPRLQYLASQPINPPSITPDDDVFKHLATVYAQNHLTMHTGVLCDGGKKFKGGITNGAAWYPFPGGMQDYNYAKHGCMELTLEISCCKFPRASQLPELWRENKMALLYFFMEAHRGITGQILDSITRSPITKAHLQIVGRNMTFYSSKNGEYWRLLLPGKYAIKVEAPGYYTTTQPFSVKNYSFGELPSLTKLEILLLNATVSTTPKPETQPPPTTETIFTPKRETQPSEESTTLSEVNSILRHLQRSAEPGSSENKGLKTNIFSCFVSMVIIELFLFTVL